MGKTKDFRKAKPARQLSPIDAAGTIYDVEAIVAVRQVRGSKGRCYEYQIQWAGYPGEDTWEPFDNIKAGCVRLLMSLWRELGAIDLDNTRILKPSKEWIDAEVQYYRKTYTESACGTWHRQPAIGYNEETGQLNIYD